MHCELIKLPVITVYAKKTGAIARFFIEDLLQNQNHGDNLKRLSLQGTETLANAAFGCPVLSPNICRIDTFCIDLMQRKEYSSPLSFQIKKI